MKRHTASYAAKPEESRGRLFPEAESPPRSVFERDRDDALKYFTDIKDNYDASPEAQNIDGLIGLAQ